jgi:hypothetical protein
MLSQQYELEELFAYRPEVVPWADLPSRVVLLIHWLPEPQFLSLLEQYGFRAVVIARHPLDTLISALVFSQHDESTVAWLDGAAGNERCIAEASPTSEAFLNYATGPRAKALLNVSARWWSIPNVCRVRYEDLVHDTAGQLAGVAASLGVQVRQTPQQVAANATAEHLRSVSVHMLYHVWQGKTGLWRQFLPARDARRIYDAHADVFRTLGYTCDPDESLDVSEAEAAWGRFNVAGLTRTVYGIKKVLCEAAQRSRDISRHGTDLESLSRQMAEVQTRSAELDTLSRQMAEVERRSAEFERQLAMLPVQQIRELAGLGPWSLETARTLQRWSHRFPRLSSGLKRLVLSSRGVYCRGLTFKGHLNSANFGSRASQSACHKSDERRAA